MDYSAMMRMFGGGKPAGGTGTNPVPSGVPGATPMITGDDFGPARRRLGGALGGFGQGLMSPEMRKTYGTARVGGYHDLMQNQEIGDFVQGGISQELMKKFQDYQSRVAPAKRGMLSGMPDTGYNQ